MSDPHLPLLERVRASRRLTEPGWVLLPLRAFLAVTFIYAGMLKLTDSTYLDPASPNSVHAQMLRAAKTSPIGPLVSVSADLSTATGLVIAFAELAVGLGVLLGLWTRLAALGGLLLSLSFFLAVSWSTSPYFFGSDIVFVFAWTPLLIAGDGGVFSVTTVVRRRVRADMGLRPERAHRPAVLAEVRRRTFLRSAGLAAGVAGVAVLTGGFSAWAAHRRASSSSPSASTLGPAATPSAPANADASPTASPTASSPGTQLGPASSVPVGQAVSFTDSNGGGPAYVVQPTKGQFKAFSAICPHAGCTVDFSGGGFVCPCHGSQFDGATGAVLTGPASSGLPPIPITVVGGTIYEV